VPVLTITSYWGQDGSGNQQDISAYCKDDTVNHIIIAFMSVFFGPGGDPEINLANVRIHLIPDASRTILTEAKICSPSGTNVFNGTDLADCSFMAPQIEACQKNGKIVTLSLGGADSEPGFSSNSQAEAFADLIWNSFLGGSSPTRPFGSAVLDGYVPRVYLCHPLWTLLYVNQGRSRHRVGIAFGLRRVREADPRARKRCQQAVLRHRCASVSIP
jgi:chitinase